MHDGQLTLRRERKVKRPVRETLFEPGRIKQHPRLRRRGGGRGITRFGRGAVKRKGDAEGRVVQRERDGRAGIGRVNDHFARAEDFDVRAAEVADGRGAG